jgi:dihydroorotase
MTLARLLRGGRIIDPASNLDIIGDLLIGPDGLIAEVGSSITVDSDIPVTDCADLIVSPGLIDLHVHLRVPGQEYKEDMATGTAAARAGGFTAIGCQPNTNPPIDHPAIVGQILDQAKTADARVHVIAAVSKGLKNTELSEMAALKESGAVGIGDDAFPVSESGFLRRAMEYCAMLDLPYIAHCEDKWLTGDGVMNEGYVSTVLGLKGIPRTAENVGTSRNILIAHDTGCHLHILHVSTKESVEIIRHAKALGSPITCETCPQYVALTDEACYNYNTNAKMSPPLRTAADQEAIKAGLADGTIDAISTDHAPHAPHEKEQEFDRAPFGMIGLETSLGLVLTHLVHPGVITINEAIDKMSWAQAKILKVPGGTLAVGAPADITLIDLNKEWTVDVNSFRSKSRNTVLGGAILTGKAVGTFVGGRG